MNETKLKWVVVFNDGSLYPAENFLFSKGATEAAQHGGVKGMALVEKEDAD